MNENTKAVDVLATMNKAIDSVNMLLSPEHARWNMELREARAAVAELIQKAETAELALRNLVVAGQIDPAYGHYADDLRAALDGIGCAK